MKKFCFFYILIFPVMLHAQFAVYPLDGRSYNVMSKAFTRDSVFDRTWARISCSFGNSYPVNWQWKSKVLRYLTEQNNFDYQDRNYSVHLNLLGDLSFGAVNGDSTRYYRNTRGFEIFGNVGKKLFYYTRFLENQAIFVPYINQYIDSMVVVPGEGWWKHFGDNGRDYTYAMGYLVYNPIKDLFLELGHGKNFIGSGYRSLILSDNSFVYPYLKVRYTRGHFSFVNMWTEFYQFHTVYYYYHYPKHASFTTFSYFGRHLDLSLVLATIWKTSDYHTYVNHFPVLLFVPFFAPLAYGLDGQNNSLVALNASYRQGQFVLYSQFVMDKIDLTRSLLSTSNRFAWQLGVRTYDLLSNRIKNLHIGLLAEYNFARPYTYASEYQFQGFYHYNQPLAHPWGAGFKEKIFQLRLLAYNLELRYNYSSLVGMTPQSGESNIFTTNIPDKLLRIQGVNSTKITHSTLIFSFLINSHTGLRLFYGIDIRDRKTSINNRTFYKFVGLATDIGRFYYDF